jgi:YidC/Oxa1 family membrane protein insertase
MDNRRVIFAMLLALAIVILWQPLMIWFGKQLGYDLSPPKQTTTQPVPGGTAFSPTTAPTGSGIAGDLPSTQLASTGGAGSVSVAGEKSLVQLGSSEALDKTWAMQLNIDSRGAGVSEIVLNSFKQTIYDQNIPFSFEHADEDEFAGRLRPLATRTVRINGIDVDLSNVHWKHLATTDSEGGRAKSATYQVVVDVAGVPTLQIDKTYTVYTIDRPIARADNLKWEGDDNQRGYELLLTHSLVNLTASPVSAQLIINGPLPPPSEAERSAGYDVNLVGAMFDSLNNLWTVPHMYSGIKAEGINLIETKDPTHRAAWIAATTTYFNAIIRPMPLNGSEDYQQASAWWNSVRAVTLNPTAVGNARKTTVSIETKPITIEAGKASVANIAAYFGPRKREILQNAYFSSAYVSYDDSLVIVAGPCSYCTFSWLITFLFGILRFFHDYVFRDWGMAIIALVVLVRLALHPVSKFSQMQMLKFGKMGPELERLRKKHGDNKEELNKAMAQMYREQGAAPIFGCLPMFLQMPIWIALWQAMNTTFELRHEPFFYGLTWIKDLSKPDHLIDFHWFNWKPWPIPCFLFPNQFVGGFNVLPIVFGVLQYIQMKVQPKPASMTPEQEQQQKITQWMILGLMPLLLYGSPSGLMVYMITSFLIGIWESKKIRRIYEAKEAEAAKFKTNSGQTLTAGKAAEPKKGLGKWLADLQEKAQQMQKDAEKRKKK